MVPEAKGAQTPLKAAEIAKADAAKSPVATPDAPTRTYGKENATSTAETGKGDPHPGNRPEEKPKDPSAWCRKRMGGQNQ